MPTYEYVCKTCGHHLEVVQAFTDAALTICPNCDGELKKIFGNVGIVFKGSGFYKTDSRGTAASTPPSAAKTESTTTTTETTSAPSTPASTPAATTTTSTSTGGDSSGS
jgi:putative FmdB family regulatory protein